MAQHGFHSINVTEKTGRNLPNPPNLVPIAERVGKPAYVDVDIVIPVYNEREQLADSVLALMRFLASSRNSRFLAQSQPSYFPLYSWNIVITDNASTDDTWPIAVNLAGNIQNSFARSVFLQRAEVGR
ncbi:glycosyltransferase [Bifidobacterium sp. ESL0798]|uniref:glycosyltransferase n=1 Tax=Bifidobacterium sp. ESL0798 TaxID=2983235 RepID=UPI0023F79CDD|nr:glycosyltransferase [Bifidobacterium sp. ESL0798]WEV74232.1 glycosyltransferase [Bifidobacterium sp. ESL0798]